MKKKFAIPFLFSVFLINCSENRLPAHQTAQTPEQIMNRIDENRYVDDLELIAVDRTLGSPGHQMVRDLCAERLAELGYQVELDDYGTGVNVIGRIDGIDNIKEEVILSAHYDSRNAGCPGADDNASGVAGALEAARVLSENRYSRTLVIAFWDEEETGWINKRGLHGSRAYAERARLENREIVLALVFEMIGYRSFEPGTQKFPGWMNKYFPEEMKKIAVNQNRGDFICLTVNEEAQSYADIYTGFAKAISLPVITLKITGRIINIHDFRRSDHTAFWEKDYSAMMIGDTINYRNTAYHCNNGEEDEVSMLDTAFACDTIKAAAATLFRMLGNKI